MSADQISLAFKPNDVVFFMSVFFFLMGDSYCLVYTGWCFPQVIDFTKGRACFGSAW